MKFLRPITVSALMVTLAGLFGLVHSVFAANTPVTPAKTTKGSLASAATNTAPAELSVPVSSFDLTNKIVKDPFFPNTLRVPIPVISTNTATLALSSSSFMLKALSGTQDQRLALINNRTLATGESAELNLPQYGKVKIVCIQIKESSVIIRAGNQVDPIEVFLPKSAR